jgi:hypothetical protein
VVVVVEADKAQRCCFVRLFITLDCGFRRDIAVFFNGWWMDNNQ